MLIARTAAIARGWPRPHRRGGATGADGRWRRIPPHSRV